MREALEEAEHAAEVAHPGLVLIPTNETERLALQAVQCQVRSVVTSCGGNYRAHPMFAHVDLTPEVMDTP
jgi:hypothetical protein